MPAERKNLAQVGDQCWAFQGHQRTLILGTLSQHPEAHVSYAPYVEDAAGCYYVLLSELAAHTRHLMCHQRCSLMFVEDEQNCKNLFARQRLTLTATAALVDSTESCYEAILADMEKRFGPTVSLLRSLPDFRLFKLSPLEGRYVCGFGQAYAVVYPSRQLQPVDPSGTG